MLGEAACRLLLYAFGYIVPAYSCFQAVERRKNESELRSWCVYWLLLAILTTAERLFLDKLVFWLPLYHEAKVLFVIYLWHPKTKGADWLYQAHLKPFFRKHEPVLNHFIAEAKTWAQHVTGLHLQRVVSAIQSKAYVALSALQNMQQVKVDKEQKSAPSQATTQAAKKGPSKVVRKGRSQSSGSDSSLDLPSVPTNKIS